MSMTSMLFLLLFLPLSLAVYYISNEVAKEYVLFIISLLFYSLCSIEYIILFVIAIVITIAIGRLIYSSRDKIKRKVLLVAGIVINTGILFYYKYSDFAIQIWGHITDSEVQLKGLALPLGISFFTFKAISYLADVYLERALLTENPVHDALYLSLFSQIQSGPLSRYGDLITKPEDRAKLFSNGVSRFLIGFNKKILIANVLYKVTSEIFTSPLENYSTLYAWLGSICYSLQLFFDFSGYSDMAIGISEMFGYPCMENFNYPYMTESVTKFWRKWHISLGQWFRDYIYIPLGGSRNKEKWRVYFNLFVVWFLTGLWHGASWNFVVWGLGYFVAIAFERLTNLPGRIRSNFGKTFYRVLALAFINFEWVLFNSKDLISGLRYIKRMIVYRPNTLVDFRSLFLLKDYGFFIAVAILLCFPVVPWLRKQLKNKVANTAFEVILAIVAFAAFAWSVSFVVAGQNNPFVYANF